MGYSLRTERYRYTAWFEVDYRNGQKPAVSNRIAEELYDYVSDYNETVNLASEIEYSAIRKELAEKLLISFSSPSVTGSDVKAITTLSCYPNPLSEFLVVDGVKPGNGIEVINIAGITLQKIYAGSEKVSIIMKSLPKGIYFIRSGSEIMKVAKTN